MLYALMVDLFSAGAALTEAEFVELADTPVVKPRIGISTAPEFEEEYDGGAVPMAGEAGPIITGVPLTVTEMMKPVAELEIVLTAALAGETPSRANAPIVAKTDALNAIIHSPEWISGRHYIKLI
jgi:hypothetical protein